MLTRAFTRYDNWVVAALSLLAAVRVLVFASAFPFFSNVDEQYHFDAIVEYSNGFKLRPTLPRFQPVSASMIGWYQSFEFVSPASPTESAQNSCQPTQEKIDRARLIAVHWLRQENDEMVAPPVYYLVAGAWYKLGGWLGYKGLFLLYWSRLIQALGYGVFVFVSFLFVKKCYPDNYFLQCAVPLFLVFFPQDVFYNLNPNSFFAAFMAASLYMIATIAQKADQSYALYLCTGLLVAATFLLGYGNWVVGIPFAYGLWSMVDSKATHRWNQVAVTIAAAVTPVFLWTLRNRIVLHDWTGSGLRLQLLGWTPKPSRELFHHPLFTARGFGFFLSQLVRNFWRGEIVWHGSPRTSWIDPFYFWSSLICVLVFAAYLFLNRQPREKLQRFGDESCFAILIASVLFLVWISLRFDFGACFYPSRAKPFLVSGRLIMGALLPFLVVYLRGLQIAAGKLRYVSPMLIVAIIVIAMSAAEIANMRPIFASESNLYSALRGPGCAGAAGVQSGSSDQ